MNAASRPHSPASFAPDAAQGGSGRTAAGRKPGLSTLGWVAIGIGAAVVASVVGYGLWLNHELNDDDRCCE